MSSFAAERLDPWRWIAGPMVACVAATLLFAAPLRAWGLQLPEPVFAMIPAFAWGVLRPSILAPFCLLALGLSLDLIWGGAMGLWAVSLLAAYGFVLITRNMMSGQSRLMTWAWYGAGCLTATGVAYMIVTLDTGGAPSLLSTAGQLGPTILLYPLADRLIARFEEADVGFR
jgi:rod shape-determining protein MreD